MSFSNSELNNFLSRTKDKISSFISNALYSPIDPFNKYNSTLLTNKNKNKSYSIDLYRSDYIPFKKKLYNSTINSEKDDNINFLGQKTFRSNTNSQQKNYNIPNDKRYHKSLLESSLEKIRNEIRQKREENTIRMKELTNKSDKLNDYFHNENNNKGKFTSMFNSHLSNSKIKDENINLDENEENIINSNSKNDFVNNSFIIDPINKLKRQFNNDFICSDINESFSINPKNKKKKIDENIIVIQKQIEFAFNNNKINNKNDSMKIEALDSVSNKFTFGNKSSEINEEKNIENNNKENDNKLKIIFGAPIEPIEIQPLSKTFTFGVLQEKKEEKKSSLFCAPKENTLSNKPLLNIPKFGCIEKEESVEEINKEKKEEKETSDKVAFGVKNENEIKNSYVPLPTAALFGFKKEEETKPEQNKFLFNDKNPFLLNIDNKEKSAIKNPFINDNNEKDEEKKTNIFINNEEKETKSVTINAIDTSNSLFKTKEVDKKDSLFGDIGIFGKSKNEEDNKEKKTSLFGGTNLFNINNDNKGNLFENLNENDKEEKENKSTLFGDLNTKKEDNNISLFKSDNNDKNNKNVSLFENNIENKSVSIFSSVNPDNNNSLFGGVINDKKSSLFGSDNNTTSLFGNDNNKSLFGDSKNDNQKSLFGDTNYQFNFGKKDLD